MPQAPSRVDPAHFFGSSGLLARQLPGYEDRGAQRRLSEAVERVLEDGGVLLAEAGTGTGKTLAYLLPAVEAGRRVVISTGTKNLQEQLVDKDIPVLARALGRPLSVAVMKGRGNYLCLTRFESFRKAGTYRRFEEIPLFQAVERWLPDTTTGDRAEIEDLPDGVDFWREISATSENCVGGSCPSFQSCFVTRMRQDAERADLVIVNHHLLCADLAVKDAGYGAVIPDYDTLVLDEAHLIEDTAAQYFGKQVSSLKVDELCRDVERELKAATLDAREVYSQVESLRHRADSAFKLLARAAGQRLAAGWMSGRAAEEGGALLNRLQGLSAAILAVPERGEGLTGLATRAAQVKDELGFLLEAKDPDHVYFCEARGRYVALRATPIDVAPLLRERLWQPARAAVLTSATLAVDGGFAHLRSRLGLEGEHVEEVLLPSPYDFARQAVLYVPKRMPEPQSPAFVDRAAEETEALLELSQGRAFVLFTSYQNLHKVAERLAGRVPWPLLVQGEAPRATLIEQFRRTPHAVLLATASFWQGVDVAGEQLSCVIVDKLPFASPADPVVSARIDRLKNQGGNPFAEYQVPVAILMLKQGLGRLIRSASDRGILAVLDSRLVEKSYGRRFLQSLPPARLVHDLEQVREFAAGLEPPGSRPQL